MDKIQACVSRSPVQCCLLLHIPINQSPAYSQGGYVMRGQILLCWSSDLAKLSQDKHRSVLYYECFNENDCLAYFAIICERIVVRSVFNCKVFSRLLAFSCH